MEDKLRETRHLSCAYAHQLPSFVNALSVLNCFGIAAGVPYAGEEVTRFLKVLESFQIKYGRCSTWHRLEPHLEAVCLRLA